MVYPKNLIMSNLYNFKVIHKTLICCVWYILAVQTPPQCVTLCGLVIWICNQLGQWIFWSKPDEDELSSGQTWGPFQNWFDSTLMPVPSHSFQIRSVPFIAHSHGHMCGLTATQIGANRVEQKPKTEKIVKIVVGEPRSCQIAPRFTSYLPRRYHRPRLMGQRVAGDLGSAPSCWTPHCPPLLMHKEWTVEACTYNLPIDFWISPT